MISIDLQTKFLKQDGLSILLPDAVIEELGRGTSARAIHIVNDQVSIVDSRGRSRRAFPHEGGGVIKLLEKHMPWIKMQFQLQAAMQEFLRMAPGLLLESTDLQKDPNRPLEPAQQRLMNVTMALLLGERFGTFEEGELEALRTRHAEYTELVKNQLDPYAEGGGQ